MVKANWFLAKAVCDAADLLLSLSHKVHAAGGFLYRSLPRDEAERILRRADRRDLALALEVLRKGLRRGLLPACYPFEDRDPAEIAGFQAEILLDLYAGEVAGLLEPWRSSIVMAKRRAAGANADDFHAFEQE